MSARPRHLRAPAAERARAGGTPRRPPVRGLHRLDPVSGRSREIAGALGGEARCFYGQGRLGTAHTPHLPEDWPWAAALLAAFDRLDSMRAYG